MKALMMQSVLLALAAGALPGCAEDPGSEMAAGEPNVAVASSGGRHCVSSADHKLSCFATFTEAIAVATNGEISDAPAEPSEVVDAPGFAKRIDAIAEHVKLQRSASQDVTPFASVIIGIAYDDANYGGSSIVFTQAAGCDGYVGSYDYGEVSLGYLNDAISSFHSYSQCHALFFEDPWFRGAVINAGNPIADMAWVGRAMNDQPSSIAWY